MNEDNATPEDFQAALATEFDLPPSPDDTNTPAPTPEPSEGDGGAGQAAEGEKEATPPVVGETGVASNSEEVEAELLKGETKEETAQRHAEEASGEAPKYATAEDVKAAMREYHQETSQRVDSIHQAREEIISKAYPEGVDRNIYDTDGQVIKTAQDIVDRGLLKENGEPYTYEEAASFMLEAGRKMAENIEELNDWAETVAEQNISLIESNKRVMEEWGDVLNELSQADREKLAETYITKQLEFDKTGSYITKMSMSPEEFYSLALAPYRRLNESLAKQREAETNQKRAQQDERSGLPPQRGSSATKPNTGDPMLDALVEELNKG